MSNLIGSISSSKLAEDVYTGVKERIGTNSDLRKTMISINAIFENRKKTLNALKFHETDHTALVSKGKRVIEALSRKAEKISQNKQQDELEKRRLVEENRILNVVSKYLEKIPTIDSIKEKLKVRVSKLQKELKASENEAKLDKNAVYRMNGVLVEKVLQKSKLRQRIIKNEITIQGISFRGGSISSKVAQLLAKIPPLNTKMESRKEELESEIKTLRSEIEPLESEIKALKNKIKTAESKIKSKGLLYFSLLESMIKDKKLDIEKTKKAIDQLSKREKQKILKQLPDEYHARFMKDPEVFFDELASNISKMNTFRRQLEDERKPLEDHANVLEKTKRNLEKEIEKSSKELSVKEKEFQKYQSEMQSEIAKISSEIIDPSLISKLDFGNLAYRLNGIDTSEPAVVLADKVDSKSPVKKADKNQTTDFVNSKDVKSVEPNTFIMKIKAILSELWIRIIAFMTAIRKSVAITN